MPRVAIVGSGLAGLTAAHILQSDPQKTYSVTILEQSSQLSLDSASVSVSSSSRSSERIDLPMRAAAGGYYHNLMRMYTHLRIPMHPVRFLFVFATASNNSSSNNKKRRRKNGSSYFVHASNLHQMPPPWPEGRGFAAHIMETLLLIICHFWFTVACFLVAPIDDGFHDVETLREYLRRIWLPRRYVTHYLLPLMSSVSTCSHEELLDFPASDVIAYKARSHRQQHYVVCGGVRRVQSRLAEGARDVRLGARVQAVEPRADGRVRVRWSSSFSASSEEIFDRVILAVSPDVAARIFAPARRLLSCIPTRQVESSILDPSPGTHVLIQDDDSNSSPTTVGKVGCCSHHSNETQVITFRTAFSSSSSSSFTEALHAMPSGLVVQTCPLEGSDTDDSKIKTTLHTARFTRTLRTRESRRVVQEIMSSGGGSEWTNGRDNVWLAGAWCWDGMVLLEGCVVSAMNVARDLGVEVPWESG